MAGEAGGGAPTPGAGNAPQGVTTNSQPSQNPQTAPQSAPEAEGDYISEQEWEQLAKRKIKRRIDGKEVSLSLADVDRGYGHNQAANKRFEEAAQLKRQVAQDKAALEKAMAALKDPKEVKKFLSQHLGEEGFSNLAHEHVMEALRRESMSPEELQAEQDTRELDEYRQTKKQQEEAKAKAERQQKVESFAEELSTDLAKTMADLGVQPQPYELESLLSVMIDALEQGIDLDPREAWHFVQKQESARCDRYLANVDVAKLPKAFLDKVRTHSVSELPMRRQAQPEYQTAPSKKEEMSASDFFNKMRGK